MAKKTSVPHTRCVNTRSAVAPRYRSSGRPRHDAIEHLGYPAVAGHGLDRWHLATGGRQPLACVLNGRVQSRIGMADNHVFQIAGRIQKQSLHQVAWQRSVGLPLPALRNLSRRRDRGRGRQPLARAATSWQKGSGKGLLRDGPPVASARAATERAFNSWMPRRRLACTSITGIPRFSARRATSIDWPHRA